MHQLISPVHNVIKSYYCSILSQIFSPCGNYLLAGSIYGEIFVFEVKNIINQEDDNVQDLKPKSSHKFIVDEDHVIYSLASTEKFLIVGLQGRILGYEWKNITSGKSPKVVWSLIIPPMKDAIEIAEVNTIVVNSQGLLYAGCGDSKVHVYSLEDGQLIRSLAGHEDYIHEVAMIDDNKLASASEDGSLRVWDVRQSKVVSMLEPHKQPRLDRPHLGKWVGTVSVEKDWLVCGGGPRVGLWHVGSMHLASTFDTVDMGVHVCGLHEDRVLIGGNNKLSQFTLQGEPVGSVPSSSLVIHSLVFRREPHRVMSLAGLSPYLDICTNFNYRDQVLSCRF